jgi:tetratricopeptide (TPR) repeat protein
MQDLNVPQTLKEAIAHHQAGRLAEAEVLYRRILDRHPRHPDALHMLGLLAHHAGHHAAGAELISEAIREAPGEPAFYSNLGNVLLAQGRVDDALAGFRRALDLNPNFPEAHNNLGNALKASGHLDEALACYGRAVSLRPGFAEAHNNLGLCLAERGQVDEAIPHLERALALRPDFAEAHTNLGLALDAKGLPHAAIESHGRALALRPDYAQAHNNLGNALKRAGRLAEAVASYRRALELQPDYAEAENNQGLALAGLGRIDEALAAYGRALALSPDFAEAHWNQGITLLQKGDYAAGWALYEWRWQAVGRRARLPDFPQPLWLGDQPVAGRTILLHHEQGLGDTLMVLRYVPLLAGQGARVLLQMPPELAPLVACVPGASQVVIEGAPLPDFDLHCPMMSLPLAFRTTVATIPAEVPYLFAPAAAQSAWQAQLGPATRPRIGLVWSGSLSQAYDQRPVPLQRLLACLERDADYVSLHREYRPEDLEMLRGDGRVRDCAGQLQDLGATAALIDQLDLVITIDTAVAHLAGGLGKPVWVLLAYAADYRWLMERTDSPWYPTMRLFRQAAFGDWDAVLREVTAALAAFVPPGRAIKAP